MISSISIQDVLKAQTMKKLHLAIATHDIDTTIEDYSQRIGCRPCVVVPKEYALWRGASFNISVRQDAKCKPGELRHVGWEDPVALAFTKSRDSNGILWESFSAEQQAIEIESTWPGTVYQPDDRF